VPLAKSNIRRTVICNPFLNFWIVIMSEMRMLVILVVPPGANEYTICHAGESFEPYRFDHLDSASDWHVAVTPEAAVALLHKGGFALYAPAMRRRLSGMMVYMIHKDGPRSCGWDGEAYEPDGKGRVKVPVEAQEDLFSHGFVGVPPEPEEPPAVQKKRIGAARRPAAPLAERLENFDRFFAAAMKVKKQAAATLNEAKST
jgi:hypothetical protein